MSEPTWNPMSQQYVEPKPLTLAEFLLARVAEDKAWIERNDNGARLSVLYGRGDDPMLNNPDGYDRMWIEAEAKRRIIALHTDEEGYDASNDGADMRACGQCGSALEYPVAWPCPTLRLLALPYADHPDYDEAWRP